MTLPPTQPRLPGRQHSTQSYPCHRTISSLRPKPNRNAHPPNRNRDSMTLQQQNVVLPPSQSSYKPSTLPEPDPALPLPPLDTSWPAGMQLPPPMLDFSVSLAPPPPPPAPPSQPPAPPAPPSQPPAPPSQPPPNPQPEVVILDDDDQPENSNPLPPSTPPPQPAQQPVQNPRKRPRSPTIIDLDDDDALQNLKPLQPTIPGLPLPVPATLPPNPRRLHISQGGGLFRVDETGTVDIVDSDDEAELREKNLIFNHPAGVATLPNANPTTHPAALATPSLSSAVAPLPSAPAHIPATPSLHPVSDQNRAFMRYGMAPVPYTGAGVSAAGVSDAMLSGARIPAAQMPVPVGSSVATQGQAIMQHNVRFRALAAHSAQLGSQYSGVGHMSREAQQQAAESAIRSAFHRGDVAASAVGQGSACAHSSLVGGAGTAAGAGFSGSAGERDEALSRQELIRINKQNELTADATEEAETPKEMTVKLMPHQKRALAWMDKRETSVHKDDDIVAVDEQCLGGILADDQGLGKTLSMIALLVKNPSGENASLSDSDVDESSQSDPEEDSDFDFIDDSSVVSTERPKRPPWRTLIVCPVSVLNQWQEEITTRIKKKYVPTVCIYHGPKRARNANALKKYDVVITTYSVLAKEYPKILKDHPEYKSRKEEKLDLPRRRSGPVCQVSWHRVVLDEAQYVKNRGTDSWSAVMSLQAEKRWCLTGTPIQNGVDDLYSLFCFIRYRFVPNYEMWNLKWKRKLEHPSENVRTKAYRQFQTITGIVLLRRTKTEKISGKPLISLPTRTCDIYRNGFADKDEAAVYSAVEKKSVLQVNKFLAEGTLNANYSSILLVLLRMRQAASHPFLIQYSRMQRGAFYEQKGDSKYSTTYSREDLEEALELAGGGHSLLELIVDDVIRERFRKALAPPVQGQPSHAAFICSFCGNQCPWTQGFVLGCGELFCRSCCRFVQQRRGCLRCGYSIVHLDDTEALINADHLRREVHAATILGGQSGIGRVSLQEFKELVREELARKKQSRNRRLLDSSSWTDDDSDEDLTLGEVARKLESRLKSSPLAANIGNAAIGDASSSRAISTGRKLLNALSQHSTKISMIIRELDMTRERNLGEKTLIFSQWTSFLDIIEFHVQVNGHEICRLDGSMSALQRQRQMKEFRENEEKNVFLISLNAGGTGLNLTASNRVILADVWWNPAVEEQAIDRVHRIGQTRPVHVSRFRMIGTVEDKIYKICDRKRQMADGTLGVVGQQNLGRTKMSLGELLSLFNDAAENVARQTDATSAEGRAAQNLLSFRTPR